MVPNTIPRRLVQGHHLRPSILLTSCRVSITTHRTFDSRSQAFRIYQQRGLCRVHYSSLTRLTYELVLIEQDRGILDTRMYSNCHVGYILSLGVCSSFRKQGVASLLLDSFLTHVTQAENQICKAIYLHVLTMNSAAIRFYEKHDFRYQFSQLNRLQADSLTPCNH